MALIDGILGGVVDGPRRPLPDELAYSAVLEPQGFIESGEQAGNPKGPTSTKVGWTLRDANGRVSAGFSFLINPQGLSTVNGSRASLFATQGSFYVDDFGPSAGQIQLRQVVGVGPTLPDGSFLTAREDVQRFIRDIYQPATHGPQRDRPRVFFHDNHFERGAEEHVYFPPDSLKIDRAVEDNGLWRVEVQMIVLERFPYADVEVEPVASPGQEPGRHYIVIAGDTLERIVVRLAGKGASATRRTQVLDTLLKLNPQLRHRRHIPGELGSDFLHGGGLPMHVYPGESLRLPS